MKKLFTLKAVMTMLLTFVMAFTSQTAMADYGWYDVTLNIGGISTNPSQWSGDPQNPTDLGYVSDLTVTSIAFKIWDDTKTRYGANMYFCVYGDNGQVGNDVDIHLGSATFIEGSTHDYSISWTEGLNLASTVGLTLEVGKTYYIDIWAKSYGSGDQWYSNNNANYHAKITYRPTTYTRTVTSGNFGTICLPFEASVSGATVYIISSKVMEGSSLKGINLESVENLEAGKAYIFKATADELVATLSGSYTEATSANGMVGNLEANDITVPVGSYVVSGNQIHEVVSGGSGVTCGQYRAYITLNGINEVSSARSTNFIGFEEPTGIESVQTNNQSAAMFNLQGQRVTDAQKGLVIVNGKKMLRK